MPIYLYEILDSEGNGTEQYFEVFQNMSDDAYTHDPKTNEPVRRVPQVPYVIMDSKQPKTVSSLAEKNTEEMIKRGDKRIQPKKEKIKPWWRPTKEKPLDIKDKSPKQLKRYIDEGKF